MEARLKVSQGPSQGQVFSLGDGETKTLGSGPNADFVLADSALAPRHVALMVQGGAFSVVDLGGGVTLNDEPLPARKPTEAWSGDTVKVGVYTFAVTVQGRSSRPSSERGASSASGGGDGIESILPSGEFEQLREIGAGAMGKVYAALWRPHGTWVAIKVLHETVSEDSPDYQRFLRECETMAQVACPYVVKVHDVRLSGGRPYSIQELIHGPSVRHVLSQRGPFSIAAALRVGFDLAQALAAAAAAGIVHRDVKPANAIVSPQGVIKLCDFGIAKDLDATMKSLTASGMGLGTMAYLPPEQVREAKHVDPRADIYSLGASLYHLIAGQPPFKPSSAQALLLIVSQEPPALSRLRPDCPREVEQLVQRFMAKEATERPPAWQAVQQLQQLLGGLYPDYTGQDLFS